MSLEERVTRLERAVREVRMNEAEPEGGDFVANALRGRKALGAVLWTTPTDYYSWSLAHRAEFLCAPVDSLCKTIVVARKGADAAAPRTLAESAYYAVVVQYTHKLDMVRLSRQLAAAAGAPAGAEYVVAPGEACAAATGYGFNAVVPLATREPLPVVVSAAVLRNRVVWLGGGRVDRKLRLPSRQLVPVFSRASAGSAGAATDPCGGCIVLDVSDPRGDGDDADE